MLAKLHLQVPFELTLPQGDQYKLYEFVDDGYRIRFDVPSPSGKPFPVDAPEQVAINGKPAVIADVISITFQKEQFSRGIDSPIDPPQDVIQKSLDFFLARLKYVSKAPQVRPMQLGDSHWHIEYLNDDGTELEQVDGLVRGRGSRRFSFSYLGCDPALWDLLFTLPGDFDIPAWHTLLVDSRGALPHVGSALVLAATALEVFVAELLEKLAQDSSLSGEFWKWLNSRKKEPSVEEQYDVLLKEFTGHTLKEDNKLWAAFQNLKNVRNTFVHTGIAKLGEGVVSSNDALQRIGDAESIVLKIREWIPEKHRWPLIEHSIEIQFIKLISGPVATESLANNGSA